MNVQEFVFETGSATMVGVGRGRKGRMIAAYWSSVSWQFFHLSSDQRERAQRANDRGVLVQRKLARRTGPA